MLALPARIVQMVKEPAPEIYQMSGPLRHTRDRLNKAGVIQDDPQKGKGLPAITTRTPIL